MRFCYEAGPTGYVLYWQLTALDAKCEVIAPTLVPVRAGDRLVTTIVVETIRSAAGNDMITTRADVATEDGEPVVSAYSTLVARGTAEAEAAAS